MQMDGMDAAWKDGVLCFDKRYVADGPRPEGGHRTNIGWFDVVAGKQASILKR